MKATETCNYRTGTNKIGNGFNGHTGDSYCKNAATTKGIAYEVRVGYANYEMMDVPMCEKHAALWSRKAARIATLMAKIK
jgi:hypothetical protein